MYCKHAVLRSNETIMGVVNMSLHLLTVSLYRDINGLVFDGRHNTLNQSWFAVDPRRLINAKPTLIQRIVSAGLAHFQWSHSHFWSTRTNFVIGAHKHVLPCIRSLHDHVPSGLIHSLGDIQD